MDTSRYQKLLQQGKPFMATSNSDSSGPLRIVVAEIPAGPAAKIGGTLLCGSVQAGEMILISPDNISATVEDVQLDGDEISLSLDGEITLSSPSLVSHEDNTPVQTDVFLLQTDAPLVHGQLQGKGVQAEIAIGRIDVDIEPSDRAGEIIIRAPEVLALDAHVDVPQTGSCKLLIGDQDVIEGRISMKGYGDQRQLRTVRATNITRVDHRVTIADRTNRFGHSGGVLWLTGLSGSGKSTLAVELEKELFNRGYLVYVLDGDNVRHGLNANLGFSPEDRSENIRRVGEVAGLFARAGFIVISAFISPYKSDRERARAAVDSFHEIFVSADLATCERRDPKGLYVKARAGEITDFTGIDAPYEEPDNPSLTVDTGALDVASSVQEILDYVTENFASKSNMGGEAS